MMILFVVGFVFLHMCCVWFWYRYTQNPSVVDVGWASGLTLSGLIYLFSQNFSVRACILSLVLIFWGLRLGLFLWLTRVRQGKIDKRYLVLSDGWKIAKPLGFFLNFQLQGILICIISLPWYFTSLVNNLLNFSDVLALCCAILAICLEMTADLQLQNFKRQYPGMVCNRGLWYYSRHPNYFFEWLVWCAFTVFALRSAWGWLAIISPVTLYWMMTRVTGPMTEQGSLKSRGQMYLDYQTVTPMFFPKFVKFVK